MYRIAYEFAVASTVIFFEIVPDGEMRWRESGGGPPQSKTCRIFPRPIVMREASWSAPARWRFGKEDDEK
jgi:hypothetical protein